MATEHEQRGRPAPPAMLVVRLVGLALVAWGLASEVRPTTATTHLAAWALAASVVPAWFGWSSAAGARRNAAALVWLGAAGGVLVAFAPIAMVFVGLAAFGAAYAFDLAPAIAVGALGPVAAAVAVGVAGRSGSIALGGAAAALGGLLLGVTRRQSVDQAHQAARVAVEHERAEAARARAGVLDERNRLAREVHDVLAHTLGALAVQLEALAVQLEATPEVPASVRQAVHRTKALASDGLVEARRAVRALRENVEPLTVQVQRLCQQRGATLVVSGEASPLSSEATLALYRVAQESLTNAAKHAPGADSTISLDFDEDAVTLAVANGPPTQAPGPLARSGSGYGLDGIGERLRLLGGEVAAGACDGGWLVRARLPS